MGGEEGTGHSRVLPPLAGKCVQGEGPQPTEQWCAYGGWGRLLGQSEQAALRVSFWNPAVQ